MEPTESTSPNSTSETWEFPESKFLEKPEICADSPKWLSTKSSSNNNSPDEPEEECWVCGS